MNLRYIVQFKQEHPIKILITVLQCLTYSKYKYFILLHFLDFDECNNADFNTCHEYAHCENTVGTYICKCFDGFFGDGEKCQGRTNSWKFRELHSKRRITNLRISLRKIDNINTF